MTAVNATFFADDANVEHLAREFDFTASSHDFAVPNSPRGAGLTGFLASAAGADKMNFDRRS